MVVFLFLGPLTEGGGGATAAPPSGSATVDPHVAQPLDPQPPRPTTNLKTLLDPEKFKIGKLYV